MAETKMGNGRPIVARQLVRRFGDTIAVDQLSFEVRAGEIYGLLGPNGAGKTTTVKMVSGLLPPNDGQVEVFGYDPMTDPIAVKKRIGLVPEDHILYESLTPREFFNFIASIRRLDSVEVETRVIALISAFEFKEYYDRPIVTLSHGNRQKASIIAALIHDPPLLVLDEPFSGLDARTVRVFKDILDIHLKNGGGILFSSHILEVAESLCDRIGIIDDGRLVAEGTVDELRELVKSHGSLEEIFLRAVQQEAEVAETIRALRLALSKKNNG
ncbi:MAG: ABC transporter ATP-binding protein [Candidatus Hodarchaeota archaeon]